MATYKTIQTNYGLSAMAAVAASGEPINLTHMAVGDGTVWRYVSDDSAV